MLYKASIKKNNLNIKVELDNQKENTKIINK